MLVLDRKPIFTFCCGSLKKRIWKEIVFLCVFFVYFLNYFPEKNSTLGPLLRRHRLVEIIYLITRLINTVLTLNLFGITVVQQP